MSYLLRILAPSAFALASAVGLSSNARADIVTLVSGPTLSVALTQDSPPQLVEVVREQPRLAEVIKERPQLVEVIKERPELVQVFRERPELIEVIYERPEIIELIRV